MKALLTIDVEAHRTVDEITGASNDSLGDILRVLETWRTRATFFVDVCEVATWGRPFMQAVCDRIAEAGHDVQLHVHPHHYTKDNSRWLLSEYTRSEQEAIFEYAFAQFQRLLGRKPIAFRAGGFGLNRDTLEILQIRGIRVDASYMYLKKGCSIDVSHVGVPSTLGALIEIPMSPVITLGSRSRPLRCNSIDFNWLPLFVIKRILRGNRSRGMRLAVLLMHSSSMSVRVGTRMKYRPSHVRKLRLLLEFLRDESIEPTTLSEIPIDEIVGGPQEPGAGVYCEGNALVQYATLLFQSFKGAGISRRFAVFLLANVCVGLAVLIVLGSALLRLAQE